MEPGVAMCLLWPLPAILECLQLLLQAAALLFQDLEVQIALDSLTREVVASLWHPHPRVERPLWRLDTSTDWWDRLVLGQWDDQQWLRNFRMRKRMFLELCAWLTPALQRATTRLQAPIPVDKRVAIAVWKLATPDSYRSLAHQFGVGRSTVGVVVMEVVHAINDVLLPRVIRLCDVDDTMAGFAALGFSNCGGALDATHIPVRAPEHRAAYFMNRKGGGGGTARLLSRPSWTTMAASRMFIQAGPAGHTIPASYATPACFAVWRRAPTSPSRSLLSGMCLCPSVSLGTRPTNSPTQLPSTRHTRMGCASGRP
ncbi:uncharacterized protein LOC142823919 [Pelodiscus sinensis]|uniref:uncharacterized protein LOC142823919 n=1 Tax=Pelodiscus sinensis TaxID=13735 RepID=UPI003F6C58F1